MIGLRLVPALLLGTVLSTAPALAELPADAPAAAPAEGDSDVIVVTGERARDEQSAGTKTRTPLLETPQSVSVIGSEQIVGLGLQNLNQALRFVAGVTPEQRGASAEVYDQFLLRGFEAPIFLDGLRQFGSPFGYAVAQVDVSRLDRVEVIKGPASTLYGQSSPGGLVAQASKMPLERDLYGAVAGTYGTFDLYRVDADIGGRIKDDILVRAYGSVNGAHDQQRFGKRRRQTGSVAVTLGAGRPTSLTLLANYSHDPFNGNYGVYPAVGTLLPNAAGRISRNFYGGEPGDFFKRKQLGLSWFFKQDLGGDWQFRSSGRYQYVRSRLGIVYTSGSPLDTGPAPRLYNRASYATREQLNGFAYDNQLTGTLQTGPIKHELLFGADRQVLHAIGRNAFGGGTPIDVFNPVYGTMPTPQTPEQVPNSFNIGTPNVRSRQQSVYAQDQMALGGLRVTVSGRQDWARQADLTGQTVQHNDKFTYRVGGLYKLPFGLAPYVSYSTSFQPQLALLVGGGLASPSLGRQLEAGAKYQVPGTPILVTAAWFDIRQTNVVVYDPVSFAATQAGRVRSRGVEVEAKAPLPYGFNAAVVWSRQRIRTLEDSAPARVGRPLLGAGRGNLAANLEWTAKGGPLAGLTLGGAVRHVDRVYAGIYFDGIARYTPSYTLVDALARYDLGALSDRFKGVQLSVNATNLFNKRYLTSCYTDYGWCWYGNRRTVQGTIGYRF